ncbi:MAG: hydroxymyristoyl-ACP dehydratase [Gammaproteobacteria bacterium]|nr:hydroxymyristoyl-ACP dehydratase [Gammaproteobacteria bacterium]
MSDVFILEAAIPAEHPSLPGHFPGQPLVPGVVILDQVCQALTQYLPGRTLAGLASAKFVAALLPGESFSIQLGLRPDQVSVEFSCRRGEQRLAQGRLLLAAATEAP